MGKLGELMWSDWSREVTTSAFLSLRSAGQDKAILDGIADKLSTGNERTRLDALDKLRQLGNESN